MENIIKYPHYLSSIFDVKIIKNLMKNSDISEVDMILKNADFHISKKSTLKDKYNSVYSYLLKNYRNEYVFKNTIVNKILLGKHSLATSTAFSEFQVLGCKLDLLVLNGTSKAYEIKTKYDNFSRLSKQLETYLKFFDEVSLVLDEKFDDNILKDLNSRVGVFVFTKRNTLSEIRKAKSNLKFIKSENFVSLLRKEEYLDIIRDNLGIELAVPNTQVYDMAKEMFSRFSVKNAHKLTINKLKLRREYLRQKRKLIENSPVSIRGLLINNNLTSDDISVASQLFQ